MFGTEKTMIKLADGGWLQYWPQFYGQAESDKLLQAMKTGIAWRHEQVRMFGKWVDQPRLTAFYGEPGLEYAYSGSHWVAQAWTPELLRIRADLQEAAQSDFNVVLMNYYRNGSDSMGWHSDDERPLGKNPVIASLSFGQARNFQIRHRQHKQLKHSYELQHGSLLVMGGTMQHYWHHQLPKSSKPMGPRINLTFRNMKDPQAW